MINWEPDIYIFLDYAFCEQLPNDNGVVEADIQHKQYAIYNGNCSRQEIDLHIWREIVFGY